MKMVNIYICSLLMLVAGCTSDYFEESKIQNHGRGKYFGNWGRLYFMDDYREVEVLNDMAFRMDGETEVAMVLVDSPQSWHRFTVAAEGTDGIEIYKRVSRYERDYGGGVKLEIGLTGSRLYDGADLLAENSGYNTGRPPFEVGIISDGGRDIFMLDCDTLGIAVSNRPATDNTLFKTRGESGKVTVSDIRMLPLRQTDRNVYLTRPSLERPFGPR